MAELAEISGYALKKQKAHKFSPNYEIRDRNMKVTLRITWPPYKLEVPTGGSVYQIIYGCKADLLIPKEKLEEVLKNG